MKKEDKKQIIEQLATNLQEYENFYLTDIATLDAAATSELRRECSKQEIKLVMVKNTLLKKALESLEGNYEEFYPILKGNTAIMFSNVANAPAKLIDKYKSKKIPALKGLRAGELFHRRRNVGYAGNHQEQDGAYRRRYRALAVAG